MTMICGCPRCSTELAFPMDVPADAALECPVCGGKFPRSAASARRASTARVIAPAPIEPKPTAAPILATDVTVVDDHEEDSASDADDRLASLAAKLRSLPTSPRDKGTGSLLPADGAPSLDRLLGETERFVVRFKDDHVDPEQQANLPRTQSSGKEHELPQPSPADTVSAASEASTSKVRLEQREPRPKTLSPAPAPELAEADEDEQSVAQREAAAEIDSLLAELRSASQIAPRQAGSPPPSAEFKLPTFEDFTTAEIVEDEPPAEAPIPKTATPPDDDSPASGPKPRRAALRDSARSTGAGPVTPNGDASFAKAVPSLLPTWEREDAAGGKSSFSVTAGDEGDVHETADDEGAYPQIAVKTPTSAPAQDVAFLNRERVVETSTDLPSVADALVNATKAATLTPAAPTIEPVQLSAPVDLGRRRRARGSGWRTLAGVVVFGIFGTLAGGYLLLWFGGERSDLLRLAQVLPDAMLPPQMRAGAADADLPVSTAAEPAIESEPLAEAAPLPALVTDAEVQAAAAATAIGRVGDMDADASAELQTDLAILAAQALQKTPSELSAWGANFTAAEQTLPDFINGGLGEQETASRTGRAYVALARLAEACALTPAPDPRALAATAELVRRAASEANDPAVLTQVAAQWLGFEKRPSAGVLLRGTVRGARAQGEWMEVGLDVGAPDAPRVISVLTNAAPQAGAVVAVAGVIAPNPAAWLPGYDGGEAAIVISPCVAPLEGDAGTSVSGPHIQR